MLLDDHPRTGRDEGELVVGLLGNPQGVDLGRGDLEGHLGFLELLLRQDLLLRRQGAGLDHGVHTLEAGPRHLEIERGLLLGGAQVGDLGAGDGEQRVPPLHLLPEIDEDLSIDGMLKGRSVR